MSEMRVIMLLSAAGDFKKFLNLLNFASASSRFREDMQRVANTPYRSTKL